MLDTKPAMPTIAHKKENKPDLAVPNSLAPLRAIRTETVFSRLPIHNLSKKGTIDIQIIRKNEHGEVDLQWLVSHSNTYGEPKQLAYKIDTIIINRKIDELGRPLPRYICLGSLHAIAQELGFKRDTASIKKAILQNSALYITAKLKYTGNDGVEHPVTGGFNRYNVFFTGDPMPDGRKADAVYLVLNDPFWGVLNNAPTRPLDYEYLKILAPSAQRFYEIVSFKIYAAIKYRLSHAKLPYSEYCTYSAQKRNYSYEQVKKQMYKVHKPHLDSGYLSDVSIKPTTDTDGNPDWVMSYIPGPKAHSEFKAFNDKRSKNDPARGAVLELEPEASEADAPDDARDLVQYFHKSFGHSETATPSAKDLELAKSWISQYGIAQSRFIIDYSVAEADSTKYNPKMLVGIQQFVDGGIQAYARHQKREVRQREEAREARLKNRYELYQKEAIDRLKAMLSPQELADMENAIRSELIAEGTIPGMVSLGVRVRLNTTLADRAGVPSYEKWRAQHINR